MIFLLTFDGNAIVMCACIKEALEHVYIFFFFFWKLEMTNEVTPKQSQ